jgi:zinc and cadmium transporter
MLKIWLYSLISVFIVSLISFIGILTFSLNEDKLKKVLIFLVSFSAGALFGGAFIHLLPEIVEETEGFELSISLNLLLGILIFFILEKFICWRHCHIPTSDEHPHTLGFMNLIGDGFHNLIDGMIIGGSYLVNTQLGITTTLAVILHEIPQEIGDFGILLYAGFSKKKALIFNFLSALTAFIGVIMAIFLSSLIENFSHFIIPLTAGGFIYIAGSDLIPELHKETKPLKSFIQLISLGLGILLMFTLTFLE